MDQKTFSIVGGVIFTLVAPFHLMRIYMSWPVDIGDWSVPMWFSWSESSNINPCAAISRKLLRDGPPISHSHLDFTMLMLTKQAVPAIAAMLGVAVSASWAVPALAGPAQSSSTTQSHPAPLLQSGDLVRLRSGGPVLTVKSVGDGWVICTWLTEYGELQSGGFPIAMVEGPVTLPPDDANPQTNDLSQE
jgi:uncharacterized protein YodC (DUF2158 family)